MKKKLLLLTIAVLCFASFASADSFITFGTRAAQNPTDFIDWSQLGPAVTQLSTPQLVTSFAGNSALVGNNDLSPFIRVDEGNGWVGNFDYGETLVWTGNSNFGVGGLGPFAIVLANPVQSIGFGIATDLLFTPFTATVDLFDTHGNPIGSMTFNAPGTTQSEAGDEFFIGIGDTTGGNIGAVLIDTLSGGPPWDHDFAIDDPSFTYAPSVPEPTSLVLLGSGLIGLAGVARRKLGR